jgi:hypothetical protein
MKYETPELTPLTAAINAVQGAACTIKLPHLHGPGRLNNESVAAYEDWDN